MGIFSGGGGGGGAPSGAAGGDLSGTYPNPAVAALAITDAKVSATAAIAKTKLASLDVVNADVNAAAAIAYSKLALGTSIVNADVSTGAAIALSKMADPTTGKVLGSAGNAAAAVFPPGYQFDYVQDVTTIAVSGSSGAQTTIITGTAVVYDGATRVRVEYFCPNFSTGSQALIIEIWLDGASLGRIATLPGTVAGLAGEAYGVVFSTPSAASHQFLVKAWKNGGTDGSLSGLSGTHVPQFMRVTKG